jgi:hypothetical protein
MIFSSEGTFKRKHNLTVDAILIGLENERGRERMIIIFIILLLLITMVKHLFID